MVSARRGWGTQRANPGAPATQRRCPSTLRGTCTQWATTGAPDAFRGATSAQGGNPQGQNGKPAFTPAQTTSSSFKALCHHGVHSASRSLWDQPVGVRLAR